MSESRKRIMLVGASGAGKRTLMGALDSAQVGVRQPLAVCYCGTFVLPPSEFLENRRFYRALITASADAAAIWLLQDATRCRTLFPPLFAQAFNRPTLGLVTKTDAAGADAARAERFLRCAGLHEIRIVSAMSGEGLEALRTVWRTSIGEDATPSLCTL